MKTQKEQISPFFMEEEVKKRLKKLIDVRKYAVELQNQNAAKCFGKSLRAVKNHDSYSYYIRRCGTDFKGMYLPKSDHDLAKLLANNEYITRFIIEIDKEIAILQKFRKSWADDGLTAVYQTLPPGKQLLVTPLILTNAQYADAWKSLEYPKKPFADTAVELYTATNLRVRSKSEVILADTLTRLAIPFRYEFPVKMQTKNGAQITFHPDFYCLNVRTRQEFIWEHFGMMNDSEYAENAAEKIEIYHANGYFEGENLIYTLETEKNPLTAKKIERIANRYLK